MKTMMDGGARESLERLGEGRAHRDRRGAAGAFLLLVLIAVGIVLLITFMPGGSAETALEAKESAETQVAMFSADAVVRDAQGYIALNGEPPADIDDLVEYRGSGYPDPWGTEMRVEVERSDRGRTGVMTIRSAGPDGEWETEDDLSSEHELRW